MQHLETYLRELICDTVCGAVKPEDIDLDTKLVALGLDSLDIYDMITAIEDDCRVDLDDVDGIVEQEATFGDLVKLVQRAEEE